MRVGRDGLVCGACVVRVASPTHLLLHRAHSMVFIGSASGIRVFVCELWCGCGAFEFVTSARWLTYSFPYYGWTTWPDKKEQDQAGVWG